MKYLLITVIVLVCFYLWRANREAAEREREARRTPSQVKGKPATQVTEIVACDVCAVHLPRSEALPGGRGVYCSDAHRKQAEP